MYFIHTVRKYLHPKNVNLRSLKNLQLRKVYFENTTKLFQRLMIVKSSPFPLSQKYRADVAAALEAGQMTTDTEKAFFSSIASAIFKYKKIPTTEDYIDVATTTIKKYPFFKAKSLSGKSHVHISHI